MDLLSLRYLLLGNLFCWLLFISIFLYLMGGNTISLQISTCIHCHILICISCVIFTSDWSEREHTHHHYMESTDQDMTVATCLICILICISPFIKWKNIVTIDCQQINHKGKINMEQVIHAVLLQST